MQLAEALRGLCLLRLGRGSDASASAERVRSWDPTDAAVVSAVRAVFVGLGRGAEGRAVVERAWQRAGPSFSLELADAVLGACASDGDLLRVQQVALRCCEKHRRYLLAASATMAARVEVGEVAPDGEERATTLAVAERLLGRAGLASEAHVHQGGVDDDGDDDDDGDVELLMMVLRQAGGAAATGRALMVALARRPRERALAPGGAVRALCAWDPQGGFPRLVYFASEAVLREVARRGEPLPWEVWERHLGALRVLLLQSKQNDKSKVLLMERSMAVALACRVANLSQQQQQRQSRGACLALADLATLLRSSSSSASSSSKSTSDRLADSLLVEYVALFGASPSCYRDIRKRASAAGPDAVRRLAEVAEAQLRRRRRNNTNNLNAHGALALQTLSARLLGHSHSLGHTAAVAVLVGETSSLPAIAMALAERSEQQLSAEDLLACLALAESLGRRCESGGRSLRLLAAAARAALGLREQTCLALLDVPIRHIQYEAMAFIYLDLLLRSDPLADDFLPLAAKVYDLYDGHALQCADVVSAALLGGNFRKVPELARFKASCMASPAKAHFDAELSLRDAARLADCVLLSRSRSSSSGNSNSSISGHTQEQEQEPDRDVRVTDTSLRVVRRALLDAHAAASSPPTSSPPLHPPLPLEDLSVLPAALADRLAGGWHPDERLFRRLSRLYCRSALALAAQGMVRVLIRAHAAGGRAPTSSGKLIAVVGALCREVTLEVEPSPSNALAALAIHSIAVRGGGGGDEISDDHLLLACRSVLREFKARNASGDLSAALDGGNWTAAGLSMGWTWAELAFGGLQPRPRKEATRLDAVLWDSATESEDLEQSLAGLEAVRVRSLARKVVKSGGYYATGAAREGSILSGIGGLGADVDAASHYVWEADRECAGCPFMRRHRSTK